MRILKSFIRFVSTILIIILVCSLGVYFSQKGRVFGKSTSSLINPETMSFEEIIDMSNEITIEKKLFSLRKHYYVFSDGVLIGEVKGKYFPIFGDTLKLEDIYGNLIKKESQIKRMGLTQVKLFNMSINRLAEVEDGSGNVTGYIGEEKQKDFWRLKHVQYFYDEDYKKEGKAVPQAMLLSKDYKIYDTKNNVDYIIDGSFFSLTHKYRILIKDKNDIDVEDAIFYTIIEDSIITSKLKESSSSSNKSNY